MKLGMENTRELGLLAVLVLVAAFTFTRWAGSHPASTPQPAAAQGNNKAGKAPIRTGKRRTEAKNTPLPVATLDPTLRLDWLKASEDREYKEGGRNIFEEHQIDIPQPKNPANTDASNKGPSGPPQPPPVQPPPPINLKFYGFATRTGDKKRIFLASNDGDVFIAQEGDIVNRRYKVLHITNNAVEIEDVLNNNKQTIPLTAS